MYNKKTILIASTIFLNTLVNAQVVVIPDVSMKSKVSISKNVTGDGITTFSHNELNQTPVVNFSDFLKKRQSQIRITNNSPDSSQTSISLRGFGDNAVANALILVDGFPLTNPSLLNPNLNSIPLADIERIDIFQGSAGTFYGNQAVGGVIYITTKHPRKFFSHLEVIAGNYFLNNYSALFGNKWPNGMFGKTFSIIGNTESYREHNRVQNNNIAVNAGYDYSRGTISLNAQTYQVNTDFPGGLSGSQFKENPRQATDHSSYAQYRTTLLQLLSQHEINDALVVETRFENTSTKGDGKLFFNFTREDTTTSLRQKLKINIPNNKLLIGYDALASSFDLRNIKTSPDADAKEFDLYLQDVIALSPSVNLTVGARSALQKNNVNAAHSINRALVSEQTLSFHPNAQWQVYFRRDGNFSFPKANENTWLPPGQTALQTQTGVSYEAGMQWQNDKAETNINLFHLILNNEIAFNPEQTPTQPFGAFNNLDQTTRNGISLAVNYQLNPKLKLNSQLNYVDARFSDGSFDGNAIPAVPAMTANAGLTYDWNEHWQTQYDALYTSSRYPSEDLNNIAQRLPAYWVHNISLQYLYKPYTLSFAIDNIFDKSYASYAYYSPATNANTYYPAIGRSFLLTAKVDID